MMPNADSILLHMYVYVATVRVLGTKLKLSLSLHKITRKQKSELLYNTLTVFFIHNPCYSTESIEKKTSWSFCEIKDLLTSTFILISAQYTAMTLSGCPWHY